MIEQLINKLSSTDLAVFGIFFIFLIACVIISIFRSLSNIFKKPDTIINHDCNCPDCLKDFDDDED